MQIGWTDTRLYLISVEHKGQVHLFNGTDWNRTKNWNPQLIFITFNQYLSTLDDIQIELLMNIYNQVETAIDQIDEILTIDNILRRLLIQYLQIIDFNKLKDWMLRYSDVDFSKGEKNILGASDIEHMTYFTDDYIDLIVFSTILKGIMPILGSYHKRYSKIIGENSFYTHVNQLFLSNPIEPHIHNLDELPPYKKLLSYIECKVDHAINHKSLKNSLTLTGLSIIHDIDRNNITDFLIVNAIWKKITIFDVLSDKKIVTDLHHNVDQKIKEINKNKPAAKALLNEDGASTSIDRNIFDKVNAVTKYPAGLLAILTVYLSDVKRLCLNIDNTINESFIDKIISLDLKDLLITDFHVYIGQYVLLDNLNSILIKDTTNEDEFFNNMIKTSVIILNHYKFHVLETLMLRNIPAEPKRYDGVINKLTNENLSKIRETQFHLPINEITETVEIIKEEVLKVDFEGIDLTNLRQEILEFILLMLNKKTKTII